MRKTYTFRRFFPVLFPLFQPAIGPITGGSHQTLREGGGHAWTKGAGMGDEYIQDIYIIIYIYDVF